MMEAMNGGCQEAIIGAFMQMHPNEIQLTKEQASKFRSIVRSADRLALVITVTKISSSAENLVIAARSSPHTFCY